MSMILSMIDDSPRVLDEQAKWGVERCWFLDQRHIDPKGKGYWSDPAKTTQAVLSIPGDVQYLAWNWEWGAYDRWIRHGEWIDDFERLHDFTVALRPDVRIGWYAFPYRALWFNREDEDAVARYTENVRQSDGLVRRMWWTGPTCYLLYGPDRVGDGDPEDGTWRRYSEKYRRMVALALNQPSRHVLPWVWWRFHHNAGYGTNADGELRWGLRSVPEGVYRQHLRELLAVTGFKGVTADGVMCWGEDRYYYINAVQRNAQGPTWDHLRAVFALEMADYGGIHGDFETYVDDLYRRYYEWTRDEIDRAHAGAARHAMGNVAETIGRDDTRGVAAIREQIR